LDLRPASPFARPHRAATRAGVRFSFARWARVQHCTEPLWTWRQRRTATGRTLLLCAICSSERSVTVDACMSSVATVGWRAPSAVPTQLRTDHRLERPRRPPALATQRASGGRGARRGPPRRWSLVRWARPGSGRSIRAARVDAVETVWRRARRRSGAPRAPARGPRAPGSARGRYPRDPAARRSKASR